MISDHLGLNDYTLLKSLSLTHDVEVGLHLTYDYNDLSAFTLQKYFNFLFKRKSKSEFYNSISSQFEQFSLIFGKEPDFVDSHQHFVQFPILRALYVKYVKASNKGNILSRNSSISYTFLISHFKRFKILENIKNVSLNILGNSFKKKLISNGLCTQEYLIGAYDLNDNMRFKDILDIYASYPASKQTIFYFHPGYEDSTVLDFDFFNLGREVEFKEWNRDV
jgi:predicted glycoside hydrolase/deacetylase ChbG (UPF0249 family)